VYWVRKPGGGGRSRGLGAGKQLPTKGQGGGCDFKMQLEFVNAVNGGDLSGWVLKKVQGGQHELSGSGIQHQLVTILP